MGHALSVSDDLSQDVALSIIKGDGQPDAWCLVLQVDGPDQRCAIGSLLGGEGKGTHHEIAGGERAILHPGESVDSRGDACGQVGGVEIQIIARGRIALLPAERGCQKLGVNRGIKIGIGSVAPQKVRRRQRIQGIVHWALGIADPNRHRIEPVGIHQVYAIPVAKTDGCRARSCMQDQAISYHQGQDDGQQKVPGFQVQRRSGHD